MDLPSTYPSLTLRTIPPGSSLYYAILFAQPSQREAVRLLAHFYQEMHEIVGKHREANVAKMKLLWWSQEILKASSQHPLAHAIIELIRVSQLPCENFQQILQSFIQEVEHPHFHTCKALIDYCADTSGAFHQLMSFLFSPHSTSSFAAYLGISLRLIDIIRNFGSDLRRGFIYLPDEDFQDLGISSEQFLQRPSANDVANLLAKIAVRARAYHHQALDTLPSHERSRQTSLLILSNIQLALLNEIERDKFNVVDKKISLTPLRKFWIAWRTHAKEKCQPRQLPTSSYNTLN